MTATPAARFDALVRGEERDAFAVLGPQLADDHWCVRVFHPGASAVALVADDGTVVAEARAAGADGLFEARLALPVHSYRVRVHDAAGTRIVDDPYRFGSLLGELDRHLIGEGRHERLYDALGARPALLDGVAGVQFAVWAPSARRVSVVGPFNDWDGRRHIMRLHPANGVWDLFVPALDAGELYKFELIGADGTLLTLKADPFARQMEPAPGNASVVHASDFTWSDDEWMATRERRCALDRPLAIYEVHAGSWRHRDGMSLSYRQLAETLVAYVSSMGYTHIELLPITEHPYYGSWGYQPLGLFAPTWRYGEPDDFKALVDACHRAGLGLIVDWVPGHFPRDSHGLARFDGTCLYEHADPRQGEQPDWGTLVYNFGRAEVANFLLASALWWVDEYHVDALRVDAVASMLYLDYSRAPGEWLPNRHGGNENLEAVDFLRRMNEVVHARGAVTIAEESTAWPRVSHPTYLGGLGFTYKWNMGWMHDTLAYMGEDPVHRRYHHERLTFGMLYADSENFILPLSHDEVVHGKGSLLARMPGDDWQRFANLRCYYAFMYGYPGKKLQFMGGEFAQAREWNVDRELDWHLLDEPLHRGVHDLVRDLNRLHREHVALHARDCDAGGFEWIDCSDDLHSVIAFLRQAGEDVEPVLVVCNFTPVPRHDYRVGVPRSGDYREILNTDAALYGGSNVGNLGAIGADAIGMHGHPYSLKLSLPPLTTLFLAVPPRDPTP